MSDHRLSSVMHTHDRQRRFVCECGESGPAVPTDGAALVEHERHASAMQRLAEKTTEVAS